jgi:hypothetical protein
VRVGLDEGSSKRGVIQERSAGGVVGGGGGGGGAGGGAEEELYDVPTLTQSKKN